LRHAKFKRLRDDKEVSDVSAYPASGSQHKSWGTLALTEFFREHNLSLKTSAFYNPASNKDRTSSRIDDLHQRGYARSAHSQRASMK
jgi:hypothetical protein